MDPRTLKVRAIIFDVYSTILDVGPPPANADVLWQNLFEELLAGPPPIGRTEFAVHTSQIVARLHADARARGIPWPEIQWPAVVREAIPSLARLGEHEFNGFLLRQMQIGRTLRLADGAADCLRWLTTQNRRLGIASNSQAYTLRELDAALSGVSPGLSMFDPALRFWSFENGFSKPDPHVFRILSARLEALGIRAADILMVGDRSDNDIAPARTQGWQTWQLTSHPTEGNAASGDWRALQSWLQQNQ